MEDKNKLKKDIDWDKIALLLKIGIIGALFLVVGDFLMGWGIKDMSLRGIEGQISQYPGVSDKRMFWSAICGLIGVPVEIVGHFGIYKTIKPYSLKYARLYAIGNLGFLTFGGAGVHVSSIESAFFYKYMTAVNPNTALELTVKFASYFLLPLYIIILTCWLIMVYAHIRAVLGGFSPYPRWCLVFSMAVGTLIVSLVSVLGNHEIVNALMVGAFSLGSLWTLAGHLMMLGKAKERQEKN